VCPRICVRTGGAAGAGDFPQRHHGHALPAIGQHDPTGSSGDDQRVCEE
jgi:hypothetical protein